MDLFNLQAKIGMDTSEYVRSVRDALKSADQMQSSNENAEKAADTLKNKIDVLAAKYDAASKRVEELTDAFNKASRESGATAEETQDLARQLSDAEKEAGNLKDELRRLTSSADDAENSTSKLSDKLKSGLGSAGKIAAAGIGAVTAAASAGAAMLLSMDEATGEYRIAQGKLNTAYEAAGYSLETANKVTHNGNFSYCGKIVNKAGGVWTVNKVAALSRFIHTHNNTQATFVNEAGGVVYVNDVHDANSTAAMNAMPKDLYDATSKGTLVWRDITTMANVDAIYKLDDNCWATDLWAELTIKNIGDNQGETLPDGVDWSKKNIRLNLESESGSGTRRGYTVNVGAQKQIKAKNLTIDNQNSGQNDASSLKFDGGAENVIVVEETLELSNSVKKPFTLTITNGATCKDLVVYNDENRFTINQGTKITYTGEYTQRGNTEETVYPNGTPQRVD